VDIERYRERLLTLERELEERVARESATAREAIDEQPDPADQSIVGEARDEYFTIASTDADTLRAVGEALRRIEDGTFGTCIVDGGPIEEKRLNAVPWTPYCQKHQQALEESAGLRTPSL
jgi:DnaK suppressor protein